MVSRQSTELRREPPQVQGPGQSRSICHQYVYIYICAKPHEMRMNLNGGDAMFLRNSLPVSGQKKKAAQKSAPTLGSLCPLVNQHISLIILAQVLLP